MQNSTPRRSFLQLCATSLFGSALAGTAVPSRAKPNANKAALPLATLTRSEEFIMTRAPGMNYRIKLALPAPINPDLPLMIRGAKPIPVYVLDADENFGAVTDLSRLMQFGGELPPTLIVGIGYEDPEAAEKRDYRRGDLTPTQHSGLSDWRTTQSVDFGGAPLFRKFLVETLQPHIMARFDVDQVNSVLVGHSFGGLFALDTFVQQPQAFGHYLAMSPSLWFDDRIVLRQLKDSLSRGTRYTNRAAIYVGDREERISEAAAHMTSNTLEFARLVADHRSQFNAVSVSVLPNTSHHTIIGPGVTQGLQYLISPPERRAETF